MYRIYTIWINSRNKFGNTFFQIPCIRMINHEFTIHSYTGKLFIKFYIYIYYILFIYMTYQYMYIYINRSFCICYLYKCFKTFYWWTIGLFSKGSWLSIFLARPAPSLFISTVHKLSHLICCWILDGMSGPLERHVPLGHPDALNQLEYCWSTDNEDEKSKQPRTNRQFLIFLLERLRYIASVYNVFTVFLISQSHLLLRCHD